MQHAPTKAQQEYAALAPDDPGADELARIRYEVEKNPQQAAAELLALRRLRLACQAKARRLPDSVKASLEAARPPGILKILESQPELQP